MEVSEEREVKLVHPDPVNQISSALGCFASEFNKTNPPNSEMRPEAGKPLKHPSRAFGGSTADTAVLDWALSGSVSNTWLMFSATQFVEICYGSPRKPSVGGENGQLHPLHGKRRLSDWQVEGSGCRPGAQKEGLQKGTEGKDCGWDVGRSLAL